MDNLFETPACLIHEVNVTIDPDKCVRCGAVNRWVVPFSIDYEAALDVFQTMNDGYGVMEEVKPLIDAALGEYLCIQ